MSKETMQAARELIKNKEYDRARKLLKTVNHPVAKEWLEKLDAIAPEHKDKPQRRIPVLWVGIAVFAIGIVALALVLFAFFSSTGLPREGKSALETRIASNQQNPAFDVKRVQKSSDPTELLGLIASVPDELWCVQVDPPVTVSVLPDRVLDVVIDVENIRRFLVYREGLLWKAVPSDGRSLIAETGLMFELQDIQAAWLRAGCTW